MAFVEALYQLSEMLSELQRRTLSGKFNDKKTLKK